MVYDANIARLFKKEGSEQPCERSAGSPGGSRSDGHRILSMGAAARDLMLTYAHGVAIQRSTADVDFAVMVNDREAFEKLHNALLEGGEFRSRPGPSTHRLRHKSGPPLDIVPFGGVERPDRTLIWPL